MKRLLKKKGDPPQQLAPSPTAHKSSHPPPPLFARFASSQSPASSTSRIISGPVPLAPRDSVRGQGGSHDGSPPKQSSTRIVSAPMQRNRMHEKQPVSGGRDDKPLPDPEQTPTQKVNLHTFNREPVQSYEHRTSPMTTDGQPQTPKKSIPEFRRRDNPLRNAEYAPVPLDNSSASNKSGDMANKLNRTPVSSSPERKSSAKPAPAPDPQPSGLLTSQNPPDRPQPRRKYSPLEAFGLVSGENSPVPSTASSVNLPSQNSNSVSTPPRNPILRDCRIRLPPS